MILTDVVFVGGFLDLLALKLLLGDGFTVRFVSDGYLLARLELLQRVLTLVALTTTGSTVGPISSLAAFVGVNDPLASVVLLDFEGRIQTRGFLLFGGTDRGTFRGIHYYWTIG